MGPALLVTGLAIGTVGTLLGTGGGFLLMPILFWLYPERSAAELTAISLAVVFFNSASGTIAYLRKKRVDVRSGAFFALATVPGAWLGTWVVRRFERALFETGFGGLLLVTSLYLLLRPAPDAKGTRVPAYSMPLGLLISLFVGFVSGLTGIGGGIIHVPAMTQILGFPVHIATATSQMILVVSSATSTVVHVSSGALATGWNAVVWLAPGVVVGAQIGAWISGRVHGPWIMRGLAVCLALVGVRLLVSGLA